MNTVHAVFTFFCVLVIVWMSYKWRHLKKELKKTQEDCQKTIDSKITGLTRTLAEQRKFQLKRIESGKISALASLSASVLHQLSQPLTAIHGGAQFLKSELKDGDPCYKPVCLIEEQSTELKRKLESLMDLVRHRQIKKKETVLVDVLKDTVNLFIDELRSQGIKWEISTGDNIPAFKADSIYMQQIFIHLLLYSMQRLKRQEGPDQKYLTMSLRWDPAVKAIVISFQNSNLNTPKQDDSIDAFFSTDTKQIGLDLALCEDLIHEHGGQMQVENIPGDGSQIIILFYMEET